MASCRPKWGEIIKKISWQGDNRQQRSESVEKMRSINVVFYIIIIISISQDFKKFHDFSRLGIHAFTFCDFSTFSMTAGILFG